MAVRYILVGGYPDRCADGGKSFTEEVVRGFEKSLNILVCPFARERNVWSDTFQRECEFFQRLLPVGRIGMEMAVPEYFLEQLKRSEVLYLKGGESARLIEALKRYPELKDMFQGKTIVGSSAGADALSRWYYDLDAPGNIRHGLDFIPMKLVVHYRSEYNAPNIDWDEVDALMAKIDPEFLTMNIREGCFEVLRGSSY